MISAKGLKKSYQNGDVVTHVLKGIDFSVDAGEFVSIMGKSGAGKSTLLYQLSLLDDPTSGEVLVDGHATHTMSSTEKMNFRLRQFGYVFQDYALLPELTALENVALPLLMQGSSKAHAYREGREALERAGLGHRPDNLPSQLSGGEQQRVSIVRAVVHKPKVLFADEPTANLDNTSSRQIMGIFRDLHTSSEHMTIIMVTHEEEYARLAQRIITIEDGMVAASERVR